VSFSFRRRAGSILNYILESSPDLKEWSAADPALLVVQPPRNLFNGAGTAEVLVTPTKAGRAEAVRFIRVRPLGTQ
jgi:hypothetical protein